jgi:hypothetical protein
VDKLNKEYYIALICEDIQVKTSFFLFCPIRLFPHLFPPFLVVEEAHSLGRINGGDDIRWT